MADARLDRLPARIVPLLFLGTAHLSLAFAALLIGLSPRAVAGFFYHPWMVAIVHLVTLGWITLSILGAIYIVGPIALGTPMPARRRDYVAYGFAITGIVGMVAHCWIEEFGGMAWSAATVTVGILLVAARVVVGLRTAPVHGAIKLHIALACANIVVAATAGILLAFDKVYHFLPGFALSNVFAHAHLAAIGWATMMLVGVAYRLLPMMLPARMPVGRSLYASAVLLEVGVLGLFGSLIVRSAAAVLFGATILSGLAVFAAHVVGMIRSPLRRPVEARGIDFGLLHAGAAGVWLLIGCAVGSLLLTAPTSDWTLRAALVYGVCGLLGFLAQMIVAMEARLLPLYAWYWAFANTNFRGPVVNPHAMRDRTLQMVVFVCWLFAVPALAIGFFVNGVALLAAGAWALFAGVVIGGLDNGLVIAHALRVRSARPNVQFTAAAAVKNRTPAIRPS